MCTMCGYGYAAMVWGDGQGTSVELLLTFHLHTSSGDQTQTPGLYSKHLSHLNQLTSPNHNTEPSASIES